jgi:hypothetical protein
MTPADFASWGEVAGDDEASPGVDVWADIWNRQRSTITTEGKRRGWAHEEVGHPPVGVAGALEEERVVSNAVF